MYVLNAYCAADSNFELASNRGAGHILVVRKKCFVVSFVSQGQPIDLNALAIKTSFTTNLPRN
jgi:hypothetical protein